MLAYVTLGTNNKEKALAFYDAVLGEMGAKRFFANDRLQFYGVGPGRLFPRPGRQQDLRLQAGLALTGTPQ